MSEWYNPVPEKIHYADGNSVDDPFVDLVLMFRSQSLHCRMPLSLARHELEGLRSGRWEREAEEGYQTIAFCDEEGKPNIVFRFSEVVAAAIHTLS